MIACRSAWRRLSSSRAISSTHFKLGFPSLKSNALGEIKAVEALYWVGDFGRTVVKV